MLNLILKIVFFFSMCVCYLIICSDKNCKNELEVSYFGRKIYFHWYY